MLAPMEVKVESRRSHVVATFTGSYSLNEALQAYEATYDAAFTQSLPRILVDCSGLDGSPSPQERFTIGKSGLNYWLSRSSKMRPKIAVVGKPPVINGLGALVASDGGIEVQTFLEVPQALEWLGVR